MWFLTNLIVYVVFFGSIGRNIVAFSDRNLGYFSAQLSQNDAFLRAFYVKIVQSWSTVVQSNTHLAFPESIGWKSLQCSFRQNVEHVTDNLKNVLKKSWSETAENDRKGKYIALKNNRNFL